MLNNIITVGPQVLILFVLLGVGVVCNKLKIFGTKTLKELTTFVLYIVTPCVIINSYHRDFDKSMLKGLIITLVAALLSYAVNIIITHLCVKDKDKKRESVLRFGAVFSNCGFMSLPLQEALLGADGVFYGATYVAVFNIMLWTYGAFVMSGDKRVMSLKKIFINPGIIGTFIGLLFFIFPVTLPKVLHEPVKYLAALNTPIPMIIIGYHLADANLKIKGVPVYVSMFIRLVIAPLLFIFGMYFAGFKGTILTAGAIAVSAPFAAANTMFSEMYDRDTPLSAATVSLSTLLSVITMPVIVGIAAMLG